MKIYESADAIVEVNELANGTKKIEVTGLNPNYYIHQKSCHTSYPIELIQQILETCEPNYLCDEIQRDEDRFYLELRLQKHLLSIASEKYYVNKRILDFGCGSGASTVILGRLFPNSKITGLDIHEIFLSVARLRAQFYNQTNVDFILSSTGKIPDQIGKFPIVILSSVYEHLLPNERKSLLQDLWSIIEPKGILIIDGTPNRYSPLEYHTTGIPLINYFPDRIAYSIARRWSKVYSRSTWNFLLKSGIRGATEREIIKILKSNARAPPINLRPNKMGILNPVDLWYDFFATLFLTKRFSDYLKTWRLFRILQIGVVTFLAFLRGLKFLLKTIYSITKINFAHELFIQIKKDTETL